MKARKEKDGKIKKYSRLPENYKNVIGFDKLDASEHEKEGFFDVVVPVYDIDTQEIQNLHFDETAKVFTYNVVDKVLDVEKIRAEKHEEFDMIIETEMTPALMFAVIEKLAMGEPVPQELKDTITALRARESQVKQAIDMISDVKQLKKFHFDRSEIEAGKMALKSARNKK